MRAFRVGDVVQCLPPSTHAGDVATIMSTDPLAEWDGNIQFWTSQGVAPGTMMYELNIRAEDPRFNAWAPASWLRLYREDHEPAEEVESWISDLLKKSEDA
jgi:hypothetical protein